MTHHTAQSPSQPSTLNITNGDSTVSVMNEAGIHGEFLPWRDVLHEGPVPHTSDIDELSRYRARFISDCNWASENDALLQFQARDARLKNALSFQKIILWFEHDLYDQLQLIQLLHWFSSQTIRPGQLHLICTDEYLGPSTPTRIRELQALAKPITTTQLELGKNAWTAFCSDNPLNWQALLRQDLSSLPFLSATITRHMEQYPSVDTGLNRTELQILNIIDTGIQTPRALFSAYQQSEEYVFMGDSTFWIYLSALTRREPALIQLNNGNAFIFPETPPSPTNHQFRDQQFFISQAGKKTLSGQLDWISINGIDKWYGGVHLTPNNRWRWDHSASQLIKQNTP